MSPAVYDVITIHISAGYYIFRANGSRKAFTGYTAVYMESNDEGSDEKDVNLPLLKEGQELQLKEWKPEQHFTQPPPRYTEASLCVLWKRTELETEYICSYHIHYIVPRLY